MIWLVMCILFLLLFPVLMGIAIHFTDNNKRGIASIFTLLVILDSWGISIAAILFFVR